MPSEATIRRALCDTDPGALDGHLAAWLLAQAGAGPGDETAAARVSVDGKTVRGAVQADGRAVHLLAAMTGTGAVLAQREVGHKTNGITQVRPLLDPLELRGAVVTLDALHCQRETARYLVEDKHADYIFTAVKDNQPKLFDALDALPWATAPVRHAMTGRAHGRDETRTIQVLPAPAGLFPHAAQAFLIERHVANLDGSPRSAIAALGWQSPETVETSAFGDRVRRAGPLRVSRALPGAGLACPCFLPEGPQWSPGSGPARRAVASAMRSSLEAGGAAPYDARGIP